MRFVKWMLLFGFAVLISGCAGAVDNPVEQNGFNFTENEAANGEDGFNFTEDEVDPIGGAGSAGSGNEDGFEFTEDEVAEDEDTPNDSEVAVPITGNWVINYYEGSVVCEAGISVVIPASDPDTVLLVIGEDGTTIFVSGMGDAPEIELIMVESGAGGAYYEGSIDVGGEVLKYEAYFQFLLNNAQYYGWVEGAIKSEEHGCKVTRDYTGQPAQ